MSEAKCPTFLLSDDPTTEDPFGSHSRVAQALVALVQSEAGGRSIALVGSWGSGKSSVVRIATTLAAGKVNFFVFDAWAHQGDPLRRVFIEKAIQYFEEQSWIKDQPRWKREKEKLAGRLDEQTSTKQRKLTPAAIVVGLATLFLAVSFQLFSVEKLFTTSGFAYRVNVYALTAMVTIAMLIVWTLILSGHRGWGMLLDKEGGTTVSETSRNVDPTSVEFQDLFGALLDECLAARKEPFVISIDNLDRVTQSEALSVWATLRAFSELQSFKGHSWSQNVWTLVPFAPEILNKWALAEGTTENERTINNSFLAKNFQAVFRVPPPVLSDWLDFALQQLKTALPRHQEADLQEVVRIMQLPKFNLNLENLSTPREVKLFVNRLGSLHRQWCDDQVPLQMQALYLMLEDATGDVETQLRLSTESGVLGHVPPGLIGADWREWIAALHYNIPKERALHVLLSDKIINALQSGDSSYFKSHGPLTGLLRVLEEVISYRVDGWVQGNSVMLALAARAIRPLDGSESHVQRCRRVLCDALGETKNWNDLNAEVADGLIALTEWRQSKDFAAIVISVLAEAKPGVQIVADDARQKYYRAWRDGLVSVATRIKSLHPELVPTFRTSSADPRAYFEIAYALIESGHDKAFPQLMIPTVPVTVLNQLLLTTANGTFGRNDLLILSVLIEEAPTMQFGKLAEQLAPALYSTNKLRVDLRLAALLALLRISASVASAQENLRLLVQAGHIGSTLSQFLGAKDDPSGPEGVAASFIALLIYRYPSPARGAPGMQTGVQYFDTKLLQTEDRDLASRICTLANSLGLSEQLKQIQPSKPEDEKFYTLVRDELNAVKSERGTDRAT